MATIQSRKRVFKPKVRTGCVACKAHHIKCSEEKPVCMKCRVTGRDCSYNSITCPVVELWGTAAERRALATYRQAAAPEMSGYFDAPFWNASVLRISHEIPAAKHVLVAVGTMYDVIRNSPRAGRIKRPILAASQISRAIEQLTSHKTPSLVSVLLCSILFSAYGSLVDDLSSLPHIASGLSIAEETLIDPNHPLLQGMTSSEIDVAHHLLMPIIRRLSNNLVVVDTLFAFRQTIRKLPREFQPDLSRPTFINLFQAEDWHNSFYTWILCKISVASTPSGYLITDDLNAIIESRSNQFLDAMAEFTRHLSSESTTSAIRKAALTLSVKHYHLLIALKALNFVLETEHDALEPYCIAIIDWCKEYVEICVTEHRTSKLPTRKLYFGTDHSLVSPLSVVMTSARNPALRRQAVDLLISISSEEGFTDSNTAALISKALFKIEEYGLSNISCAADIPEANRIRLHDGAFFSYGTLGPRLRVRYMVYPYHNTRTIKTRTVWLNVTARRPSNDTNILPEEYNNIHEKPAFTPDTMEDIIGSEQDRYHRSNHQDGPPDMIMTATKIAWLDHNSLNGSLKFPSYRVFTPAHQLDHRQLLKF